MDLSAFIFVALAVAWAVYLVPKALKHHDDVVRSRSVDRFSHTMRVLARREPVDRRNARLVVTPGRSTSVPIVTTKASVAEAAPTAAQLRARARARREAARLAARRRRRVLGAVLLATLATVVLAALAVIGWVWVAVPVVLLVAWLVACRLMVKAERAVVETVPVADTAASVADSAEPAVTPAAPGSVAPVATGGDSTEDTSHMEAVAVGGVDPTLWDPVPVTLPTYVTKPAATRRTVRTIDLDDTGVWTSGNTAGDSRLAREAEAADQASRSVRGQDGEHRATGS